MQIPITILNALQTILEVRFCRCKPVIWHIRRIEPNTESLPGLTSSRLSGELKQVTKRAYREATNKETLAIKRLLQR